VVELIVRLRGRDLAEIEEGLTDTLGLIQDGFAECLPGQDPRGVVEFELRDGESGESLCNSPWAHDDCTHD
jgi:hypothetical protein